MSSTARIRPLLFVAALALAGLALGQSARSRQAMTYTALTAAEVQTALQEEGYKATLGKDQSGDPMLEFKAVGKNVQLFFYDCASGACKSLALSSGVATKTKPTLSSVNAWNAKRRFTEVYLDEESDPFLESDLDLEGGVTAGAVKEWVSLYASLLDDFLTEFKLR